METVIFERFLVALALGALIGLEREYARYKKRGHDYAGIRTFPLISLFGAISAFLGELISPWILVCGIVLIGALIVAAYFAVASRMRKYMGATSEIAGFLVFFLGVLSYYGEVQFAVIIGIVIALILYARSVLHHFAEKIQKEEMADTIKFALIAFVILPFLPDKGYGPLGIFNPHYIWLIMVFVCGISFSGYILIKWLGEKGIALAGIFGGLIGSTAVTTSFAQKSKRETKIYLALILASLLANTVMFIRVLIEVSVINNKLFLKVLLPMSVLFIVSIIICYFIWRKARNVKGEIHLSSPFTIGPALRFSLFFTLILAVVKFSEIYLSSKGVYLVSLVSGFAGVDAITVSLSQLAKSSLAEEVAAKGILLATMSNMGVKLGITYFLGERKHFGKIMIIYAVLIAIGLALFLLL